MAIQFFCVACKQPIEVDDEFANQAVTCPYCKKVVTTPPVSDPGVARQSPEARASGSEPLDPSSPFDPHAPLSPAGFRSNTSGWVALGCVTGVFVITSIFCGNVLSIMRGQPSDMTQQEMQKVMMEEMEARPGLQKLISVGFLALPIVGISAAIFSLVKRRSPRWPAIAALVVLVPVMCCMCFSFLMFFAQAGAQGGAPTG